MCFAFIYSHCHSSICIKVFMFLINVPHDVANWSNFRKPSSLCPCLIILISTATNSTKRKHCVGELLSHSSCRCNYSRAQSTYCDIVHWHQGLKHNVTTAHVFYNFLHFFSWYMIQKNQCTRWYAFEFSKGFILGCKHYT